MGRRAKTNAGLEITAQFIEALTADFERNGAATLERLRVDNPGAYCRLAADLTPKEPTEPPSPFDSMSIEQLAAFIEDDLIDRMAADLPRYTRLLKQARKLAKAAKEHEQSDPNPHNRAFKQTEPQRVPWRSKPCG